MIKIKKALKFFYSHLPIMVTIVVTILALDMIMRVGFWTPIFWTLIATLILLELYFTSVVQLMLRAKGKYPFLRLIAHLSAFSFLTMFLFAVMFANFSSGENYLWHVYEQTTVFGFDNAFYFSGVTMLSIGYGDIVPYGFFRVLALIEGFIGSFLILSFFSLGISQVFLQVKSEMQKEETLLEEEIEQIEEGIEMAEDAVKHVKKRTSKSEPKAKMKAKTKTKTKASKKK